MPLERYREKRDFKKTKEPAGKSRAAAGGHAYYVQKHDASHLHYDLRLELDGVLLSWAVPKGPSLNPADKRLAVHVEDHPVEYGTFEGTIPQGQYGGGTVMLWDRGTWEPIGSARAGMKAGRLKFILHGERLRGGWTLVRMGDDDKNWLLIKEKDEEASAKVSPTTRHAKSVSSGETMAQIAKGDASKSEAGKKSGKKTADSAKTVRKSVPKKVAKTATSKGSGKAAPFLRGVRPQLATLVSEPPEGDDWIHELKFDGYRLFIEVEGGKARVVTARSGLDWTSRFRGLARAAEESIGVDAILDGEAVVVHADGRTDFQALQNALRRGEDSQIVFCAFDLLLLDGRDLRGERLEIRKRELERLLAPLGREGTLRFSRHIAGSGQDVFAQCCQRGMEGVISKRLDSAYMPVRNRSWVKSKCRRRQELVIGGMTEPRGSRQHFGAILLGVFEGKGKLRYAGKVGTGFSDDALSELRAKFAKLQRKTSPFSAPIGAAETEGVTWLEPKLVAEIEFAEWTQEGIIRHGAFAGLREDKPAREVRRESVAEAGEEVAKPGRAVKKPTRNSEDAPSISHGDRVLYPASGTTKNDLAAYYKLVTDWILPHIANRPLALVRCPDGRGGECFFQKHLSPGMEKFVKTKSSPGTKEKVIYIDDQAGLIQLVQFSALEIHTWGCHVEKLEKPDLMVFDLDPGEDTPWKNVVDAAVMIRDTLASIDIESFVKVSGGKGLHVCSPLDGRTTWEELKDFTRAVAVAMEDADPALYISTATKARRRGRIFIDYLRNGRGATCVAAYSTRAREKPTVSLPISWKEAIAGILPDAFDIESVAARLAGRRADPWKDFFSVRQGLTATKRRSVKLKGR